jgi:hypothetical protein
VGRQRPGPLDVVEVPVVIADVVVHCEPQVLGPPVPVDRRGRPHAAEQPVDVGVPAGRLQVTDDVPQPVPAVQ